MVFPGRFSTGCSRCRQRKVKCDEGKPSCRRCYIYGKPCPGYSDQFRFRHSSQSQSGARAQSQSQVQFEAQPRLHSKWTSRTQKTSSHPPKDKARSNSHGVRLSPAVTTPPVFDTVSFVVSQPLAPLCESSASTSPTAISPCSPKSAGMPGFQCPSISLNRPQTRARRASLRRPLIGQECESSGSESQDSCTLSQSSTASGLSRRSGPLDSSAIPYEVIFPQITPQPELNYNDVSLSYFVSRFVSPDGADSFPGHLTWLPDLYDHYNSQGPFELATLSVAQMAAYTKFGSERFRWESYRNHGRALRALQDVINGDDDVVVNSGSQGSQVITATDDRILAAVLLLCAYKDISGEGLGDPSSHASGLFYLLEKRGLEQLTSRRSFELLILSFIRLQVYSFLHEDDTYCDPGGLATFLSAFDPLMRAMFMMSKVHCLRHDLAKHSLAALQQYGRQGSPSSRTPSTMSKPDHSPQQDSAPPSPSAEDVQKEAGTIHACFESLVALDEWDSAAADYWKSMFETRTVPTLLGGIASVTTQTHYDPETACTIILIRSVRLVLVFSLLEHHQRMQFVTNGCYERPGGHGESWSEFIEDLKITLHATINDILALVPFALGDIDPSGRPTSMAYDGAGALMILHPLRLITFCPYASVDQVMAGAEILRRFNSRMGIRSARPWSKEATAAVGGGWPVASTDAFYEKLEDLSISADGPVEGGHLKAVDGAREIASSASGNRDPE